jgi:hypothetical protein
MIRLSRVGVSIYDTASSFGLVLQFDCMSHETAIILKTSMTNITQWLSRRCRYSAHSDAVHNGHKATGPAANKVPLGQVQRGRVIGAVRCQPFEVREELIPGDVTWMVIRNDDKPLPVAGGAIEFGSRRCIRFAYKIGIARIRRCRCRIGWPGCRALANGIVDPDQLAIPNAAIRPSGNERPSSLTR